jgi:PhoPQ-activated pathogenicity-related protein
MPQRLLKSALLAAGLILLGPLLQAGALEDFVKKPDSTYQWKFTETKKSSKGTAHHLELISQTWRGHFWSHHLMVVQPRTLRHPDIALLIITGDGEGDRYLDTLQMLSDRAGAITAVITKIPNQPLFDGRKEDALIAYTCDQYLRTRDPSWPLLFPMVKSAVRGMDTIQAFVQKNGGRKIERFVLTGASKRGWTTWLTAAADPRVTAIAPMVIDMLNMDAQTEWAQKMYGRQSEEIKDYTDLNLVGRQNEPAMKELRAMIDPYSYRDRYKMPKLLLLGTNDPYWVVDSLRHYWNELPEPKLVFQTPNAGHNLAGGEDAYQTLAAFFQMVADGDSLPQVEWKVTYTPEGDGQLQMRVDRPSTGFRVWNADSSDRDFRNEKWYSREIKSRDGRSIRFVTEAPSSGYKAFMGEVSLKTKDGFPYRLSTSARVAPDGKRP